MSLPNLYSFDPSVGGNPRVSFSPHNFAKNLATPQFPPGLSSDINSYPGTNFPMSFMAGNQNALRTLAYGDVNSHLNEPLKKQRFESNIQQQIPIDLGALESFQFPPGMQGKNLSNNPWGQSLQPQAQSSKASNKQPGKINKQTINDQTQQIKKNQVVIPRHEVEIVDVESDDYLSPYQNNISSNDKAPFQTSQNPKNYFFPNQRGEEILSHMDYLNYFNRSNPISEHLPFPNLPMDYPLTYKSLQGLNPNAKVDNFHDFFFLNGLSDMMPGELNSNSVSQHQHQSQPLLQQPKRNFNQFQREVELQQHPFQSSKAQSTTRINKPVVDPIVILDDSPEPVDEIDPSLIMGPYPNYNPPVQSNILNNAHKAIEISTFNPRLEEIMRQDKGSLKRPFNDNDVDIKTMSSPHKRIEISQNKMVRVNPPQVQVQTQVEKPQPVPKKEKEKGAKQAGKKAAGKQQSSSTTKEPKGKKKQAAEMSESPQKGSNQVTPFNSQDLFRLPNGNNNLVAFEHFPIKPNELTLRDQFPPPPHGILTDNHQNGNSIPFAWNFEPAQPSVHQPGVDFNNAYHQPFNFKVMSGQVEKEHQFPSQPMHQSLSQGYNPQEETQYQPILEQPLTIKMKIEDGGFPENAPRENGNKKKEKAAPKRAQTYEAQSSIMNKEPPKERKLNKLQMIKFAYQTYIEELRKPYTIDIHINPENPDSKIVNTKVGEDCQVDLNRFNPIHRIQQTNRYLMPIWNPDVLTEDDLENYYYRFGQIIGQKITNEVAMTKNLVKFEMDVERALENIRKNQIFYRNSFRLDQRVLRTRGSNPQ